MSNSAARRSTATAGAATMGARSGSSPAERTTSTDMTTVSAVPPIATARMAVESPDTTTAAAMSRGSATVGMGLPSRSG